MSERDIIYLDNSATTKVDPEVTKEMLEYFNNVYGNPSSINRPGIEANSKLRQAREKVAEFINAAPNEIIFTGSGTESDNFALLRGSLINGGKHIITSAVEHSAILKTVKYMETIGYNITILPVNSEGMIDIKELEKAIRPDTALISIMMSNNEVGTVMPIEEIGEIAASRKIPFHVDAVQSAGKTKIDVDKLKIDLLTLTGHKIYAPKGVGLLYAREEIKNKLSPLITGGGQEFGLRSGTENLPYIAGLAKAMDIIIKDDYKEAKRIASLRDHFEKEVLAKIPETKINGSLKSRVESISNITFKFIEAEAVIGYVPSVACSLGSACSAKDDEASHVLTAMKVEPTDIRGSIRFSFGRYNTIEEVNEAVSLLQVGIEKLRAMSPLYKKK